MKAWLKREASAFDLLCIYQGVVVTLLGCSLLGLQPTKPPAQCEAVDLAALEAAYVGEAAAACRAEGATSTATCKAFPAIRDKYRAKRAAWVECGPAPASESK